MALSVPRIAPPEGLVSGIQSDDPADDSGTVVSLVTYDDGSVEVVTETEPDEDDPDRSRWYDNLALRGSGLSLSSIGNDVWEGVEADILSREQWTQNYNSGLDLLGLKANTRQAGIAAKGSQVRHPLMLDAIVAFQARAEGEMLPASGPVKVRNDGEASTERDKRADDMQEDFNHYLTVTATEYYPDTDRMLFYLGYGGTTYKKVYYCPVRQRPVSEAVYGPDLIVSQDATDLDNAIRVTHRVEMRQDEVRRMQDLGVWAGPQLSMPSPNPSSTDQKEAQLTGIAATATRWQDISYTIYECYTRLDLSLYGFEGRRFEGVRPYKVVIDRDTRQVLSLVRNWREDDEEAKPRRWFVKYDLIRGMGFLGVGFLHLVGDITRSLTAILREMIDAGMFANFPGGVRVKGMRLETNELQPNPGEFLEIDTAGMPIQQALMALPFKGPAAELFQLYTHLEEQGMKIVGAANLETGDARTNMPVGTVMAMIESQTEVTTGIHKRMHQAQQEEFMLLKECFAEHPDTMPSYKSGREWTAEDLEDMSLVPASDPNTPAMLHRVMKATILETLASKYPQNFNQPAVLKRLLDIVNIGDPEELLVQPQAPQPDPIASAAAAAAVKTAEADAASAQAKAAAVRKDMLIDSQRLQLDQEKQRMEADEKAKERESRERIATMNDQTKVLIEGLATLGQPAEPNGSNDDSFGP